MLLSTADLSFSVFCHADGNSAPLAFHHSVARERGSVGRSPDFGEKVGTLYLPLQFRFCETFGVRSLSNFAVFMKGHQFEMKVSYTELFA